MIIDCHCHAGQGDGFSGPWDTDAPLHAYLQRAARAGIARRAHMHRKFLILTQARQQRQHQAQAKAQAQAQTQAKAKPDS